MPHATQCPKLVITHIVQCACLSVCLLACLSVCLLGKPLLHAISPQCMEKKSKHSPLHGSLHIANELAKNHMCVVTKKPITHSHHESFLPQPVFSLTHTNQPTHDDMSRLFCCAEHYLRHQVEEAHDEPKHQHCIPSPCYPINGFRGGRG